MFSVVIPLFNKAPHIEAALRSVLSQTVRPAQIIVVDDGSTDAGAEIVAQFNDPALILFRQDNQGVSAARNQGAVLANSDYIAFLDADDSWAPHHLATLQALIQQCPHADLFSTMHEVHLGDRIFRVAAAYPCGFSGLVDDFFRRMAAGLSLINATTACVTRRAFFDVGGFPLGMRRGEDLVLWIKLAARFKMAHSATITAIYNRDAINRSVNFRETSAPGSLLFLRSIISSASPDVDRESAMMLFRAIAFYTAAGMREAGDWGGVVAIRRLAVEMKLPVLWFKLAFLTLTPSWCLTFARRFRHMDVKDRRQAVVTSI
jgi:glycosyltransferase involved in cell wall biosynthesis